MARRVALSVVLAVLLGSPGCTLMLWRNLGRSYPDPPAQVVGARSVRAWRDVGGWTAEVTGADGVRSLRVVAGEGVSPARDVAVHVTRRDANGRELEVVLRDGSDVRRFQVGVLEDEGRPVAPFVAGVFVTPLMAALDLLGFPITIPILLVILLPPRS